MNEQRVWDKLEEIGETVARLDTKMDMLVGGPEARIPLLEKAVAQHESRWNKATGIGAALLFLGGLAHGAIDLVGALLHRK
jgi:hypothetical protein